MEFRRSRSASKLTTGSANPNNKYEIGQMLGQGQFGKVYLAHLKCNQLYTKGNQTTFAIKIIPMGKLKKNPKLKQLLTNQIKILGSLKHENIIKFEELYAWQQRIYMVYEYCQGGSLQDLLPLSEKKALDVFTKIIKACRLAQKNNVLHRDLKPANILFKGNEPKVADWGFSRYLKEQLTATSFVGSPAYMAPELLNGSEYTSKADIWSFGVMLYECLFNQMPWQARSIKDLLLKQTNSPLKFPKQISPIFKTILKICLQTNPHNRATFQKLQKTIQLSKKISSITERSENPQQSTQLSQLSQSDIRKCSYYLQFAKQTQKFQDTEAKAMCLELILHNLKKIKDKYAVGSSQENYMTPCHSQRKMSLTKRQARSPRTINRSGKISESLELFQTHALLNKQILLIEKIKKGLSTSFMLSPTKPQSERSLMKQLLKRLMKGLTVSEKSLSNTANLSKAKRQLIQMNCILQIMMYEELSHECKEKKLGDKIKQMQQIGLSGLMRMVNCKMLYFNQHFSHN